MVEATAIATRPIDNFFKERLLKFEIIAGFDQRGNQVIINGTPNNHIEIDGFKSEVEINYYGAYALPSASIKIYNVHHSIINQISTVGIYDREALSVLNQVIIYATNETSTPENPSYTKIFEGSVVVSYVDWDNAPDVVVNIEAQTLGGNYGASKSLSFNGSVPVVNIVNAIVSNAYNPTNLGGSQMVRKVINRGIDKALNNFNGHGTFIEQLNQCAQAGDFDYSFHNHALYIYPKGSHIDFQPLLFSTAVGMIGYPKCSGGNIIVRSIFKPQAVFGQSIRIEKSQYEPANGVWHMMVSLSHSLTSLVPGGSWFTTVQASKELIRGSVSNGQ